MLHRYFLLVGLFMCTNSFAQLKNRWLIDIINNESIKPLSKTCYIEFTNNNNAVANVGCNTLGFSIEVDDINNESGKIKFFDGVQTAMACFGDVMNVEKKLTALLPLATHFKINEDKLFLFNIKNEILLTASKQVNSTINANVHNSGDEIVQNESSGKAYFTGYSFEPNAQITLFKNKSELILNCMGVDININAKSKTKILKPKGTKPVALYFRNQNKDLFHLSIRKQKTVLASTGEQYPYKAVLKYNGRTFTFAGKFFNDK